MVNGPKCGDCSLAKIGSGFTAVEIGARYAQTRLLLIGEASGEAEARDSLPFRPYAQSGSLLADAMREMNVGRADVAITNVLRCRPVKDWLEGAPWQYNATNNCLTNYLYDVIQELKPTAILALGGTAMRAVIAPVRGRSGTLDYIRGYALPGAGVAEGIPVISTYHPAFLRRGASHLTPLLQRDLRRAFLIAIGKLRLGEHYILDPLQNKGNYLTQPTIAEARQWLANIDPDRSIYADIETPRSRREDEDDRNSFADRDINLIQFTQRRGEGIAIPWRDDFVDVARSILHTNNRKVGHNWLGFDLPVLSANGVVVNGVQDDTMLQFHHYHADLPQNLQAVAQFCGFPFAWKHLSESEPEFYGCLDVDATCWADETTTALLNRDGLMESYQRYVQKFYPILRDMANRGLPISDERRLELKQVIIEEDARATEAIKAIVPDEVLAQKQKFGYKNPPILKCNDCGFKGRVDHFCPDEEGLLTPVPYADLAEENGLVLRPITVKENEKCRCTKTTRNACDVCLGLGIIPAGVSEFRWAALTEFNPNSTPQVKRFMRWAKHPIPKHAKRTDSSTGEASETTEVKELEKLWLKTKHPIYPLLIEKRQLAKIDGTYVEGWKPGRDGRIHSTFTLKPATWQTSCCAPWTPITTRWGVRPIHLIEVGDQVFTHRMRWRKVTAVWVHPSQPMYDVHFETGHVLTCTAFHRLLCFDHGNHTEVVDSGKHRQGIEAVSGLRLSDTRCAGEGVEDIGTQHWGDTSNLYGPGREAETEQSSILTLEDGQQESYAWKDGSEASQVHRRGVRWVRLLDLLEGRQEAVCASGYDGRGVGIEDPSSYVGHSSHRREQTTQSSGQLCIGDEQRTSKDTWDFAAALGSVRITKIVPVGNLPVHDITVEEDESYESEIVFSHNSREPNIQNGLKHGRTEAQKLRAKAFNAMQKAEVGHKMINFDFKSFHAQTTACEAGLPDYLRLAKIDIHSFVTCHYLKLPERIGLYERPGEEMKEIFKRLKKDEKFKFTRDFKAKKCLLGLQFSMGPRKLYQLNSDDFENEAEAKAIHSLVMVQLFPGLGKWHKEVIQLADDKKLLQNKYGAIRRFYDAMQWDRRQQRFAGGEQAEAAVAFLPASSAFGHVRDVMIAMHEKGWDERYQCVNTIHDSLVFHCPDRLVEECTFNIKELMEQPSPVLIYPICPDGLAVEAEVSVGDSLAEMEEIKLVGV